MENMDLGELGSFLVLLAEETSPLPLPLIYELRNAAPRLKEVLQDQEKGAGFQHFEQDIRAVKALDWLQKEPFSIKIPGLNLQGEHRVAMLRRLTQVWLSEEDSIHSLIIQAFCDYSQEAVISPDKFAAYFYQELWVDGPAHESPGFHLAVLCEILKRFNTKTLEIFIEEN